LYGIALLDEDFSNNASRRMLHNLSFAIDRDLAHPKGAGGDGDKAAEQQQSCKKPKGHTTACPD
jgi:hypothetical protein